MVGRIDEQKDYIKSLEFFKILNENKIKFTDISNFIKRFKNIDKYKKFN